MSEPKRVEWSVYILRCADGSYYVGHTRHVNQRVAVHQAGEGAKWTAARRPVQLVYQEPLESEAVAMRREKQIKHWSRAKKTALIAGDRVRLSQLSVNHGRAQL
jgi:predicted GIY-YIG superfamily endonuclease